MHGQKTLRKYLSNLDFNFNTMLIIYVKLLPKNLTYKLKKPKQFNCSLKMVKT